jgi:phosphoadenosine phosphosulfate reductase
VESFRLPTGETLQKVNPLAHWSTREVWEYARENAMAMLPPYDRGYQPCTALPADPSNLRSGRWNGRKLECGIHVPSQTRCPASDASCGT